MTLSTPMNWLMRRARPLACAGGMALMALNAWAQPGPQLNLPRAQLQAGMHVLDVQLAQTPEQRQIGLMWRKDMPQHEGMLFVFEQASVQCFWMRNTLIPLDMVFIGADRRVVGVVHRATPETDDPRDVPGEWLYVLEVAGGMASRWGVRAGDAVQMVGVQPVFE